MWAILAAPLFMSNDLRNITNEFKEVLQNKKIIDVNQDPLGIQGQRVKIENDIQVWLLIVVKIFHIITRKISLYIAAWYRNRFEGYQSWLTSMWSKRTTSLWPCSDYQLWS